jgi:hypothetical protein
VVHVEVVELLPVRLHGWDAGLRGSGEGVWMAGARSLGWMEGGRNLGWIAEEGVVPDGEWDSATYRRNHA